MTKKEPRNTPEDRGPPYPDNATRGSLLMAALRTGLIGGTRWERNGDWLAVRPAAVWFAGDQYNTDHRGRCVLDLSSVTAAFWHLIGHEPAYDQAGFFEAIEKEPQVRAAAEVFQYLVQTAIDGTDEDWANVARMHALIDPPRVQRVRVVAEVDRAIRRFHDPTSATVQALLKRARAATPAHFVELPPFDAWPPHEVLCVRLLVQELSFIEEPLEELDPKLVHRWLKRSKPGKTTGAGNIGAVRVAAALSLAVGAFDDVAREEEREQDALDRIEMRFRKAINEDAKRAPKKGVPGR